MLFLIILYSLILVKNQKLENNFSADFTYCYLANTKNLIDYKELYGPDSCFIYPPLAVWFFLPFLYPPLDVSIRLWTVISLVSFFVSCYLVDKLFFKNFNLKIRLIFLLIFLVLFPLFQTIVLGQVNSIVLLLTVSIFYLLEAKKDKSFNKKQIYAGLILAFGVGLKITPVILLIYLLLNKYWRSLVSFFIGFIIFNLLTISVLGIKFSNLTFYTNKIFNLSPFSKGYGYTNYALADTQMNQSLSSFLTQLIPNEFIVKIIQFIVIIFLLLIIIYKWYSKDNLKSNREVRLKNWELYSFLLAFSILLFGAFTWEHHLILLYPLLSLTVYKYLENKNNLFLGLLIFIFISLYLDPYIVRMIFEKSAASRLIYTIVRYHALLLVMFLFILSNLKGRFFNKLLQFK